MKRMIPAGIVTVRGAFAALHAVVPRHEREAAFEHLAENLARDGDVLGEQACPLRKLLKRLPGIFGIRLFFSGSGVSDSNLCLMLRNAAKAFR